MNSPYTPPSKPISGGETNSPIAPPGGVGVTYEQLIQLIDVFIIPYIENKLFGSPEIDLNEQKKMTPAQRTRFVARLLAKGRENGKGKK